MKQNMTVILIIKTQFPIYAHNQEKASNVPRPFPHMRGAVGSGNETDGEVGWCHDHLAIGYKM